VDPQLTPARAATLSGLLGLAWPIIVSRSSQVVVGVSDAIMVAPLGESALAATTTGAFNTFNLLILPRASSSSSRASRRSTRARAIPRARADMASTAS